jgi:serine/threonine-protein kinase
LILEYVKQGNLFYIIRNRNAQSLLTEDEAFYFFIQTVAGIYFLHKNGFIHRDLKPGNVGVRISSNEYEPNPRAVILDFGSGYQGFLKIKRQYNKI